ncbi:hypothetical protein BRD02_00140 [Halobacteriales archaeon QS_8_69_73]|nr:MAG: hypothetical protein BRD02_00140 [Halobacteriales archaeon QS_8_69_73]
MSRRDGRRRRRVQPGRRRARRRLRRRRRHRLTGGAVQPSQAGESVRVVGTNPFIVGSEGAEGNRFRELVERLDVDPYVFNTGRVGTEDVGVETSGHHPPGAGPEDRHLD